MTKYNYVILLLVTLIVLLTFVAVVSAEEPRKNTFGWVERAALEPALFIVHAKLDTGADNSSLDASNIEEFDKDGAKWVRFTISNRYKNTFIIEKPVRREAIIRRHGGKHQRRKVIRLGVCLGDQFLETDVTLVDRRSFDYQMLLGRSFLAGYAVVDPAITYTSSPACTLINE